MMSALYELVATDPLGWLPKLTLVYLLATQPWHLHAPYGSVSDLLKSCCVVLVTSALFLDAAQSWWVWCLIVALHGGWVLSAYFVADNHHFLIGYWCLTIALALGVGGDEGSALLSKSATVLVGLCFSLAVVMKLSTRAYREGTFFTWALLQDSRFLPLARVVGGVSPELHARHRLAAKRVWNGLAERDEAPVPERLRSLAVTLTWWTVLIESVVAVLFLWPSDGGAVEVLRVVALITFSVSTFTFVSVEPFGQVLLIMLVAATTDASLRWSLVLLICGLTLIGVLPRAMNRVSRLGRTSKVSGRGYRFSEMGSVVEMSAGGVGQARS